MVQCKVLACLQNLRTSHITLLALMRYTAYKIVARAKLCKYPCLFRGLTASFDATFYLKCCILTNPVISAQKKDGNVKFSSGKYVAICRKPRIYRAKQHSCNISDKMLHQPNPQHPTNVAKIQLNNTGGISQCQPPNQYAT